jgi:hypothetical protein
MPPASDPGSPYQGFPPEYPEQNSCSYKKIPSPRNIAKMCHHYPSRFSPAAVQIQVGTDWTVIQPPMTDVQDGGRSPMKPQGPRSDYSPTCCKSSPVPHANNPLADLRGDRSPRDCRLPCRHCSRRAASTARRRAMSPWCPTMASWVRA